MGWDRVPILLTLILFSANVFGSPFGSVINETEFDADDFYLEDALGKWLNNFDTYTFMVEQDVDDDVERGDGGEEPIPEESSVLDEDIEEMEEEEEVDDYDDDDQDSSAPIVLVVQRGERLLDPEMDYKVKLESLVAEEGSVLVTLGTFGNSTACGVGGFSLSQETEEMDLPGGRLDISHHQEGNRSTTFVAFARGVDTNLHQDEHANTTASPPREDEHSEWLELSQNRWWSAGRLTGGGLLTLIYTPPECGCITLKAYYALPIGDNLTLVVGAEAYPAHLEKLLCVDPSSPSLRDNLIEDEQEEADEFQAENPLEDSIPPQEEAEEEEEHDLSSVGRVVSPARRGRGRWSSRKRAKLERKKLRQKARQAIRRAGRRVSRQKARKHLRMRRRESNDLKDEQKGTTRQPGVQSRVIPGRRGRKQARKEARKQIRKGRRSWKGKKPWKKHRKYGRKQGRRNKHNKRNRHHRHHNGTEDGTPSLEEDLEDSLLEEDDHFNITEPESEDEELANFLLGEDEEDAEDVELETSDVRVTVTDDPSVHRRFRNRRRQRARTARKMKNKDKKKGVQFCCKQGIKYKKSKLMLNNTIEEDHPEIVCDANEIILTFAVHQFPIENTQCAARYEICCSKFTLQLLEAHKAKKAARKAKRKQQKQQRKAARQGRRRPGRRSRISTTTPLSITTEQ